MWNLIVNLTKNQNNGGKKWGQNLQPQTMVL